MKRASALLALAMLLAGAPSLAGTRQPGQVELHATRFYRGGGTTLIDAFCRVPFGLLEAVNRQDGRAWYRVEVRVRDSAGAVVQQVGWSDDVAPDLLRVAGASAVEHFVFSAPAGSYRLEVTVTDSASGRVTRAESVVAAFGGSPLVSDVLLSSGVRRGAAGDTATAAGEIRKGALFITAATRPVLTPTQAKLFYYVELYPRATVTVNVTARVQDGGGRQLAASTAQVAVPAGGGVASSGLDLTGLPPGEYQLVLEAAYPDTTVTRTSGFAMAGFETEAAVSRLSGGRAEADQYSGLAEAQLDSLYEPMVYLLEAGERGVYGGLSVEGKRNYLRRAWARRDPTPGTPANEEQAAFYERIRDANQRFRESGAGQVVGWRTDRGRILTRFGEPEQIVARPQTGPAPPYEVWKYTRGRPRRFVFMDETRLGNYVLVYTDERSEPSRPNWEQLLGAEAAQDALRN